MRANIMIMDKIVRNHFKDRVRVGEYIQTKELTSFPIDFEGRVLEVGCGARPSYSIDNIDFYGADITPDMIRIFRENYPSATLIICDVKFLPFKSSTFNLIVSTDLLHHLVGDNPSKCIDNIKKSISEMNMTLKPKGIILIHEYLSRTYLYTLIMYYVTLFCAKLNIEINSLDIHSKVIIYPLTKKKLISILKENGYQIKEIRLLNEWKLKGFKLGSQVEIHAYSRLV